MLASDLLPLIDVRKVMYAGTCSSFFFFLTHLTPAQCDVGPVAGSLVTQVGAPNPRQRACHCEDLFSREIGAGGWSPQGLALCFKLKPASVLFLTELGMQGQDLFLERGRL